jgi:hypothetical protein
MAALLSFHLDWMLFICSERDERHGLVSLTAHGLVVDVDCLVIAEMCSGTFSSSHLCTAPALKFVYTCRLLDASTIRYRYRKIYSSYGECLPHVLRLLISCHRISSHFRYKFRLACHRETYTNMNARTVQRFVSIANC